MGFWKNEWDLFLQDMESIGRATVGFFVKEWELFVEDMKAIKGVLSFDKPTFLSSKKSFALNAATDDEGTIDYVEEKYELDPVEHKVVKFLCEDIGGLKTQFTSSGTQLDALKAYAEHFQEYKESPEMCHAAFQKYYDKHALRMAVSEVPVEQIKIVQNNADLFVKGQETFGEGAQFIDSRVDNVFEKAGKDQVVKMLDILSEGTDEQKADAERTFAELVQNMVDSGIKVGNDGDLVGPFKKVLESKLDSVHTKLKSQDEWNQEYQSLLTEERKCLYSLNKIEQHETEKQIKDFEKKLAEIDDMFE